MFWQMNCVGETLRSMPSLQDPSPPSFFLKGKSEEQIAELSKMPPLERLAQPEDIARVVSFLAGPDGAWVNSQVLRANGGFAY